MKINPDLTLLERLVTKMGANAIAWESEVDVNVVSKKIDWKVTLETKGLEVDIKEVEITEAGLLRYNGEQILLYIKEISTLGRYALPKFHFYQCATLNAMQSRGRFERYVVTQRKSGFFLMDKIHGHERIKGAEEKLDVCKNCLNWYNHKYRKKYTVSNFDIPAFFEQFTTSPITSKPKNTDNSSNITNYKDAIFTVEREIHKKNDHPNNIYPESVSKKLPLKTSEEILSEESPFNDDYVDIVPVDSQICAIKLDIDDNTQNFEDMF